MKKNKLIKIIIAILIAITIFFTFHQNSFALNYDISHRFDGTGDKSKATNDISSLLSSTINFFQVIGLGIGIIMLIVIAIKWIYAAPSGKAQIAKTSKYYVLGSVFILTAVAILQIIKNFTVQNIRKAV